VPQSILEHPDGCGVGSRDSPASRRRIVGVDRPVPSQTDVGDFGPGRGTAGIVRVKLEPTSELIGEVSQEDPAEWRAPGAGLQPRECVAERLGSPAELGLGLERE
jgi:hypothetical protein